MRKKGTSIKIDPKVKDILLLLGAGTFLTASIIMPGLPLLAKPFLDAKREKERNEWKKFNSWRLKQVLKRLYDKKLVDISYGKDDVATVTISDEGRKRLLKYDLDNMKLKDNRWDGKWRIIIYDIFTGKKKEQEFFRRALKKLQFLKLQKSIYLTPFPYQNEIEYLRQVCDIGKEVLILTISGMENESVYKEYFGLS